mmetsp:Transcript_28220/g.96126  ORF Transcript_28220/g.96126 Transcript_28220/m.96126 type:complete len:619 (-) Transcript_28220:5316-7172(-)
MSTEIVSVPVCWYTEHKKPKCSEVNHAIQYGQDQSELAVLLDEFDTGGAWRALHTAKYKHKLKLCRADTKLLRKFNRGFSHSISQLERTSYGHVGRTKEFLQIHTPEPKRRFLPSKWEARKVLRIVRGLRKLSQPLTDDLERPSAYLLWRENQSAHESVHRSPDFSLPPKLFLPETVESYNAPCEYTHHAALEESLDKLPMSRTNFNLAGTQAGLLRKEPQYNSFVQDRFQRCLDLYLCPRVRKMKMKEDISTLLPSLPKLSTLQPFPSTFCLEYKGHCDCITSVSVDESGQWLLTSSRDQTVRVWNLATTRCIHLWNLQTEVCEAAWCPSITTQIVSACTSQAVFLLDASSDVSNCKEQLHTLSTLETKTSYQPKSDISWSNNQGRLSIISSQRVKRISWHCKGDYFATISQVGCGPAILVHQLSTRSSQRLIGASTGRIESVCFHTSKPYIFVATECNIKVFDLVRQTMVQKLKCTAKLISDIALHPDGNNLLVGSSDSKIEWFDLDLSTKAYKVIRSHSQAVRAVAFHNFFPLFASASDDGTVHLFHGKVYSDVLQNPLLVPLKVLHVHEAVNAEGVLDICFHPKHPWILTAGADGTVRLFRNEVLYKTEVRHFT